MWYDVKWWTFEMCLIRYYFHSCFTDVWNTRGPSGFLNNNSIYPSAKPNNNKINNIVIILLNISFIFYKSSTDPPLHMMAVSYKLDFGLFYFFNIWFPTFDVKSRLLVVHIPYDIIYIVNAQKVFTP